MAASMAASKVHCTLAVIVVDGNIRSFLYCSTEIEEEGMGSSSNVWSE